MVYVKWVFWGVFWAIIFAFLNYTLPQHDIARITDTYEKRVDFRDSSIFWSRSDAVNTTDRINRDVFFIQVFRTNNKPMIYRNEDTGWGWPPYFKFNSANLQAEASDLISKRNASAPQWVSIRHYGWRSELLTIYPNAISIKPVSGPDVTIIPWFNILFLTLLAALFWGIWARWKKFWARREKRKLDDWG